jgi:hypothetical protein
LAFYNPYLVGLFGMIDFFAGPVLNELAAAVFLALDKAGAGLPVPLLKNGLRGACSSSSLSSISPISKVFDFFFAFNEATAFIMSSSPRMLLFFIIILL